MPTGTPPAATGTTPPTATGTPPAATEPRRNRWEKKGRWIALFLLAIPVFTSSCCTLADRIKGKGKSADTETSAPPVSQITFGPPVITVSTESPSPFKFVEQGPTYRFGTIAKAPVNTQANYAEVIIQPGKSSMEFTTVQVLGKKVVVQEMSGIQALVNGTDIVDIPERGEFTLPSNTITVRFFHKDKQPFGVATLY